MYVAHDCAICSSITCAIQHAQTKKLIYPSATISDVPLVLLDLSLTKHILRVKQKSLLSLLSIESSPMTVARSTIDIILHLQLVNHLAIYCLIELWLQTMPSMQQQDQGLPARQCAGRVSCFPAEQQQPATPPHQYCQLGMEQVCTYSTAHVKGKCYMHSCSWHETTSGSWSSIASQLSRLLKLS